jgi:hypothetical protein
MTRLRKLTHWSLATLTAAVLASGSAAAQVGGIGTSPLGSPLGMTSPLGIGPAPAVPRTGIPMGATELSSPGVSPMTFGASPLGPAPATSQAVPVLEGRSRRRLPAWEARCQGPRSILECRQPGAPARARFSTAAARRETRQAPVRQPPAARLQARHRRLRRRLEWGWDRRSAALAFRWARPSSAWEA